MAEVQYDQPESSKHQEVGEGKETGKKLELELEQERYPEKERRSRLDNWSCLAGEIARFNQL